MIEKISQLRKEKTNSEIEKMLLSGELGKIYLDAHGYQHIAGFRLSHLVTEVHKPGFIEKAREHPFRNIVHHIDANPRNDIYSNLQVTTQSKHMKIHFSDSRYAETRKVRAEKLSEAKLAYYADPENAETAVVSGRKQSATKRKNWLSLETFKEAFTIGIYSKVSNVNYKTAERRLGVFLKEERVICVKQLIDSHWHNVYSVIGK